MDGMCAAVNARATGVQALVVRQFAGSRVERQLLSQVFDLIWPVGGHAASRNSSRDYGWSSSPIDDHVIPSDAFSEGGSR
jgi:hypothetical protein